MMKNIALFCICFMCMTFMSCYKPEVYPKETREIDPSYTITLVPLDPNYHEINETHKVSDDDLAGFDFSQLPEKKECETIKQVASPYVELFGDPTSIQVVSRATSLTENSTRVEYYWKSDEYVVWLQIEKTPHGFIEEYHSVEVTVNIYTKE